MKKTIIFIVIIILLGVGWFFLQDEVEEPAAENGEEVEEEVEDQEPVNNEDEEEEEEVELDADNPYVQTEEIPPIPGVYETAHESLEEVFNQVFSEVKLIDSSVDSDPSDPKFNYVGRATYMVPVEIDTNQAGEIRDAMVEQGWNITSTDTDADSYVYHYEFDIDGETYNGRMDVILGEVSPENAGQEIRLDIRQNSN